MNFTHGHEEIGINKSHHNGLIKSRYYRNKHAKTQPINGENVNLDKV